MSKFKNRQKARENESASEAVASEVVEEIKETVAETLTEVSNNFADAAAKIEEAGGDATPSTVEPVTTNARGVIPDQFGNNVKGSRVCSNCGILESEMLAKNPRYSLCKGVCVNCYGKLFRKNKKPADMTVEEIEAKIKHYTDLLAAKNNGAQGSPDGSTIENVSEVSSDSAIESRGASGDATIATDEELATISE